MAKRTRKPGEGTISSQGRYPFVEVSLPNGRRQRRYLHEGDDAAEVLRKLRNDVKAGQVASRRQTVGDLLATWLAEVVDRMQKEDTRRNYHWAVESHLTRYVGNLKLASLSVLDVQRAFNRMADTGQYNPSTLSHLRKVLSTALKQAMKWELIAKNPCGLIDLPPCPKPPKRSIPSESIQAYLDAIKGHRLEAFYVLCLGSGLRSSEARGLTWADVDMARGVLTVDKQLKGTVGAWRLADTKTESSKRRVHVSPFVIEALRAHRTRQKAEQMASDDWHDYGLVFTNPDGQPLSRGLALRILYRLEDAAGLSRAKVHDLRHTYANGLLESGVVLKAISEILGHSSIAITSGVYTETTAAMQKEAARALEAHWFGT